MQAPEIHTLNCPSCGTAITLDPKDEVVACSGCGKQFKNPYYDPQAASAASPSDSDHTEFTGHSFKYFLICILNSLQIIFTLGLGTMWAKCRTLRWQYNNKIINGKRLVFDGKAGEIFGKWFGWTLLQFITIGAYTGWKNHKMEKWYASHIHIEGEEQEGASYLDSTLETYVGTLTLSIFTAIVTFGIGTCWALTRYRRWECNSKVIDGYRLCYTATSWQLLGKKIIWALLFVVTLSISSFFMPRVREKWLTANLHLEKI